MRADFPCVRERGSRETFPRSRVVPALALWTRTLAEADP